MIDVAYVFISQFFMILLVGLNQLNVVHNHIYMAMTTSLLISVCSFYNVNAISQTEAYSPTWFAFIIAGGIAIGASMKLHPIMVRAFNKADKNDTDT